MPDSTFDRIPQASGMQRLFGYLFGGLLSLAIVAYIGGFWWVIGRFVWRILKRIAAG